MACGLDNLARVRLSAISTADNRLSMNNAFHVQIALSRLTLSNVCRNGLLAVSRVVAAIVLSARGRC